MKNKNLQCEVLVVGAGVSGMSAAIKAHRKRANVLLIEKNNDLGGILREGVNNHICGLYANGKNTPRGTLNDGIAKEICSHLKTIASSRKVTRIGKVYVLPFFNKDLMLVFTSLIQKEKHLKVLSDSKAVSVKTSKNVILEVGVKRKDKSFTVKPKVVIDCSGEGDIIRMSGAGYSLTRCAKRQLAGYSIRVKGILNADDVNAVKVPYYIRKAINEKKLPAYLKYTTVSFLKGTDESIIKFSVIPVDGEPNTGQVKDDARRVRDYLAQEVPAFKKSRIINMSSNILNREGLRIKGEYTLKTTDVINARKFSDGVVKNAWPIEFWDQKKGPRYQYLKSGDHYQIPVRCLKSKDVLNLYCAGRCISVSHEALGSTRVMGTCISLGEEAGLAAAQYAGCGS